MNLIETKMQPSPYRDWYASEEGKSMRWLFPTISSLAYMLRKKQKELVELDLIVVLPTRGYFIRPNKFNEESIKPFFTVGA